MQTAMQVSSTWSNLIGQFDANTNFLNRLKVIQDVLALCDQADFGIQDVNGDNESRDRLYDQLRAYDWRMFAEIGGKEYLLHIAISDDKGRVLFSTADWSRGPGRSQSQLVSKAGQKDRAIVLMHGDDAALAAIGIVAKRNALKLVYTRTLVSGVNRNIEVRGAFIEIIDVAELLGQIGHDRNIKVSIRALDGVMTGDAPCGDADVDGTNSETVRAVKSPDNGATYYVASLPIRSFDNSVVGHIVLSNELL